MDIELFVTSTGMHFNYLMDGGDFAHDRDLKTAVLLSLWTDRRAEDDDQLPDPAMSKRGWWGDALGVVGNGRRIGSRLWLLHREKQLKEVLNRAKEYALESLNWLVEDGVARNVFVDAEVVANGILGLIIAIERDNSEPIKFRFEFAWDNINQVRK